MSFIDQIIENRLFLKKNRFIYGELYILDKTFSNNIKCTVRNVYVVKKRKQNNIEILRSEDYH